MQLTELVLCIISTHLLAKLNSDLSDKADKSYVEANTFGTSVDLATHTTYATAYTCPSDGYVQIDTSQSGPPNALVYINNNIIYGRTGGNAYVMGIIYVRKGMKVHVVLTGTAKAYFIPLE